MRGSSLLLALALPLAAEEPKAADPRVELRQLEVALARAADRVASPNVFALNEAECRGYRIAGVGAVFVLPPRALRPRSLLVWRVPEAQAPRTPRPRDPRIRVVERQAVELQREAERTHAEVERAIDEMRREIERRRAAELRAAGITPPGLPSAPVAPLPPAPAEAPEAPPPPPPWAMWLEAGDGLESEAPAESVVPRMRASLIEVLAEHGLLLQGLRPEETIAAAVDFVPSFPFGGSRPEKTLVLRVKKKDLEDRRSGKISPEQLRTRIEVVEY